MRLEAYDIYKKIDFDKLKKLTDKYLLDIKKEIKNAEKAKKGLSIQ